MSEVKQKCEIDGCSRAASTRCYCCNKSVCTRHFTEHIGIVRAQVHPLADAINTMAEKIQSLTVEQLTEAPLSTLIKWRCDMHQLTDEIFSSKSREIEELLEKNKEKFVEYKRQQWKTIVKIQENIKQLTDDGDATFEQFRSNFLSINVLMFGQGFVTISSTLNQPWVIPNTTNKQSSPPPPPQQSSMWSTYTAKPVNHTFDASTYQSSGFHRCNMGIQGTSPTNLFGSGVFSLKAEPTMPAFSSSSYLSVPEDKRFFVGGESVNRRLVIKSKRRAKP